MRRKAHMIHSRSRRIHRVWTFYVQGWGIRKGGTGKRLPHTSIAYPG